MTTSLYPNNIDGYAQIKVLRNRIDPVIAGDHNDLRDAILAVERTLGVLPQGPFGTVVERLNDAYSNIEAHVLGYPPRHPDSVIVSPARNGSLPTSLGSIPYNLSMGSVATQLLQIVSYLNDTVMYGGSGATHFADGYALPFSTLRQAVTQIIKQFGSSTIGTSKVSGALKSGVVPTGLESLPYNLTAKQLHLQLEDLLKYLNDSVMYGGSIVTFADGSSLSFSTIRTAITNIVSYLGTGTGGTSKISGAAKIGSTPISLETLPYNLTAQKLSLQLEQLITHLNDSIMYGGSGNFADLTSIPFSKIRDAITQIVSYLGGGVDGTKKISGDLLTTINYTIVAKQLSAQLQDLLDLINAFAEPTGASEVGAEPFITDRYKFNGTDVKFQIEEAGDFIEESAYIRELAFDAFVISGMEVTGSADIVTIAAGIIFANGRMINYTGGSIPIIDLNTNYVYAEINDGVVSVSNTTINPFRLNNPTVLLHKVVRSGGSWTTSIDLRRFGLLTNNKNYFTVGNGTGGKGYDFGSLKSAVAYIKIRSNSSNVVCPKKIILSSDITIGTGEMEILLDYEIEIDGGGMKITTNVDKCLFDIQSNNIIIKDLVLESNLVSAGAELCLAKINASNVIINNCKLTKTGSFACPYFLRINGAVTNSSFSNNIVDVHLGGIEYLSGSLTDSIISENNIYQSLFISANSGIKASSQCIISNNIIDGGFNSGIYLSNSTNCIIQGNVINGFGTYMLYGIKLDNSTLVIISDNFINNVTSFGIDGFGKSTISNNIIFGVSMLTGINLQTNSDYVVTNNIIGSSTIPVPKIGINMNYSDNCLISNNIIKCNITGTSEDNGIKDVGSLSLITNNYIYRSNYDGISIAGSECICSNNIVYASKNSGIVAPSDNNIINSNKIIDTVKYGISISGLKNIISNNCISNTTKSAICLLGTSNYSLIIGNNIIDSSEHGISISGLKNIISNNCISNTIKSAICLLGTSNYSLIIGNNIIDSSEHGILLSTTSCENSNIVGNVINTSTLNGISINSDFCSVKNNNIITSGLNGIYYYSNYCSITSNNIRYSTTNGIQLIGRNSNISNNYIVNSTGNGIDLSNTGSGLDSIIGNNYIINANNGILGNSTGNCMSINNNHINRTNVVGIDLDGADDCVVSSNIINDFYTFSTFVTGIDCSGTIGCLCNNNKIISSSVIGTVYGINITAAQSIVVVGNSIDTSSCPDNYPLFDFFGFATCIVSSNIAIGSTNYQFSGPPLGNQYLTGSNWNA